MKNLTPIKNLTLIFAVISFVIGCKKETPASPKVTATTFTMTSWTWSAPNYYVNLGVPEITSSNNNSAAVMVYFSKGGSWLALPYTQYNWPDNYYMGFNTNVGQVQVTWFYDNSLSSGDNPNVYYGTTIQCKVVVIPPAVRKANPDVDLNNYEEVKERFHLDQTK